MIDSRYMIVINYYLNLIVRRFWVIIIPLIVAMIVGSYYAVTLPRIYSATTSILVEAQRVPSNYVRSLVSIDINSRIATISQQILSRTNLEKIIKQFQLYASPEQQKMFMEEKVKSLRKRITVELARTRGSGADAFSISFRGSDPEKVMQVANALATYFIDENLKVREAQAIGTSSFLEDELTVMRKKLVSVETAMREFRKLHMGELPEQLDSNLRMLDRLQVLLAEKETHLRMAKENLVNLRSQTANQPSLDMGFSDFGDIGEDDFGGPDPQKVQMIAELRENLKKIKLRYTERHPDVVRITKMIESLEEEIRKEEEERLAQAAENPEPEEKIEEEIALPAFNFQDMQQKQLEDLAGDIARQQQEVAKIKAQITEYEQRVENTPKREQELISLQRDYSNIQGQYESLLNRRLEAEIAVNMERKQKGEQFRILDPARLPQTPISPNLNRLFALTLIVGFGLGAGVIFLLDFFNTSFKTPSDVESVLGFPILAVIPTLLDAKALKRRRFNLMLSSLSIVATLALLAGFAVLVFYGIDETRAVVGRLVSI